MIKKITLRAWYCFATVLVLFALIQGSARYLITKIPNEQIEKKLSQLMGVPVHVNHIRTGWYWFTPVIQLSQMSVSSAKNKANPITIKYLSFGIDLWESLLKKRVMPGLLYLEGARIHIDLSKDGSITLPDTNLDATKLPFDEKNQLSNDLISWFFKQDEVYFKDVSLALSIGHYHRILKLKSIKLVNQDDNHFIQANLNILQPDNAYAFVTAHFKGDTYNRLSGPFYISLTHLPVSLGAHNLFVQDVRLTEGVLDAQMWGELEDGSIKDFQSSVLLNDLKFFNTASSEVRRISYLNTTLFYEKHEDKVKAQAQVDFDPRHLSAPFELMLNKDKKGLKFQLSRLGLRTFMNWFDFFALPFHHDLVSKELEGELKDLQFVYDSHHWEALSFEFEDLGFHVKQGINTNNLTGKLSLNANHGHLMLNSHDVGVSIARPYGKAFTFDEITGDYRWERVQNRWRVTGGKSHIKNANMSIMSDFNLDWTGQLDDSSLEIKSTFDFRHLDELRPYIPEQSIKETLSAWLKQALVKVPVMKGTFELKGKLGDFPFEYKPGLFHLNARLTDSTLKFLSDWPSAKNVSAHIEVNKSLIDATLDKVTLGKNQLDGMQILLTPLGAHDFTLYMQSESRLHIESALEYLFQTPVKKHLGLLEEMYPKGYIDLSFGLTVPLYPENDENYLRGRIAFLNNEVGLCGQCAFNLNNLKGHLFFDEEGISQSKIEARLWDNPLHISLRNTHHPKEAVVANASGTITLDKLRKAFDSPFLDLVKGSFDYRYHLMIPEDGMRHMSVSTGLKKVSIDLPPPFRKFKNQSKPLYVKLRHAPGKRLQVKFDYDKFFKGQLAYRSQKGELFFDKGDIRFNQGIPSVSSEKGLTINAHLKQINLNEWNKVFHSVLAKQGASSEFDILRQIKLRIDKMGVDKTQIKNITLNAKKLKRSWSLFLSSQILKGNIAIDLDASHKTQVELDYLRLKSGDKLRQRLTLTPSQIPPLNVQIKQLVYENIKLGQVRFKTKSVAQHLYIDDFTLETPSYMIQLKGDWEKDNHKQKTTLKGFWESENLAKTLDEWHLTPAVHAQLAHVDFSFMWPDDLYDFEVNKLNGSLNMRMGRGRITHLSRETEQELAIGKILSIISLKTIPRRLQLDFSDLAHKGFSFDVFEGDFLVKNGKVETKNAYFDGPVAFININGSINLMKKQVDLMLKVSPHIIASIPAVATIAAGPVAGVIAWATGKMMTSTVQRVIAYTYQVQGGWNAPHIDQLEITHRPQQYAKR